MLGKSATFYYIWYSLLEDHCSQYKVFVPPIVTERALLLRLANQPNGKIADQEFIYYLPENRDNHIPVRLLLISALSQAPFLSIYVQLLSLDIPNEIMMGDIDGSERRTLESFPL